VVIDYITHVAKEFFLARSIEISTGILRHNHAAGNILY
jgi:hypothetical protein